MRIAVFGDVHGDVHALDAVLRDVGMRGVEGVVHLGDLVGEGAGSEVVVERIRAEGLPGVVGDWDLKACAEADAAQPAGLGQESLAFLKNLPAQILIAERGVRFLFAHASPERPDEPALSEAPDDRLRELLQRCEADVLVVGHSHRASARQIGEGLVLNPGSVARAGDGDPRPSYLILDTDPRVQALRVRVEIGVERPTDERVIS